MSNINTGGPAFPTEYRDDARLPCSEGMTLRDYFAAKAMQGLLACALGDGTTESYAKGAYEYADAMLKARDA